MKIGLDADFVVNLLATQMDRHERTYACYEEHRVAGAEFVLAENVLLEAFSVLSRAPEPARLPPRQAEQALLESFGSATLAPIRAGLALKAIRHTLDRGFAGGRVYDTAIALAVYDAGARLFLTWNVKHFLPVAPVGLEIRHP